MTVRPVVHLPQRVLSERAQDVGDEIDTGLVADLVDTMRASPACVGLAAPQIGVSRRMIVVDVTAHPKTTTCHGLVVMADPVLVGEGTKKIGREGCMSVRDLTANVARWLRVTVRGRGPEGDELEVTTEGFEARAFQHEVDHLDGLLILDRVASLATDVFRRMNYR
jgi:peptide deformylase